MPGYPGDGFHIDPDDLGARAAETDGLADRVRRARTLTQPVDLQSYGITGQGFAAAMAAVADQAGSAIDQLATATTAAADGLRATQTDYVAVEQAMAAGFDGVGR